MCIKKDFYIQGISFDSRMVKPGHVFFALRGQHQDGHRFFDDAFRRGAKAAVIREDYFLKHRQKCRTLNVVVVKDVLDFLGRFAKLLRKDFKGTVVGITGSCGKTTTKNMLSYLTEDKKKVIASPWSFNNFIGLPFTVSLAKADTDILILECGTSHPGEIRKLSGIALPDYSIITVVGPSHLEYFGSVKKVFEEKIKMASFTGKAVLVNSDDRYLKRWKPSGRLKKISVGFKKGADYTLSIKEHDFGRINFSIDGIGDNFIINTGFAHHVYNASLSIVMAYIMGFEAGYLKTRISGFRFGNMRTQLLKKKGIFIINDAYNSNPLSLEQALKSIETFRGFGRKILVLSDMLEQGRLSALFHRRIGKKITSYNFDYLLCYGRYGKYIYEAAKPFLKKKAFYFMDKGELAEKLRGIASRGDLVLIKGSRATEMETVVSRI